MVAVAGGGVVPGFEVQLARAAPAATVAVSLMKVRRERGGRGFMVYLRSRYRVKELTITTISWLYYKLNFL
jgi:hypothetical protein